MKKTVFILLAVCAMLTSCNRNEDGPTKKEKNMVKEEMTWALDSVQVIYNYQTSEEISFMLHKEDGITVWSYTFFPWKYKFPSDLTVQNAMSGETFLLADKYSENYCKYICNAANGTFLSGGYVCYYNDMFCLRGVKADGMAEMRIVDAEPQWNTQVWTITYNPIESDNGTILERRIEYYSRVR